MESPNTYRPPSDRQITHVQTGQKKSKLLGKTVGLLAGGTTFFCFDQLIKNILDGYQKECFANIPNPGVQTVINNHIKLFTFRYPGDAAAVAEEYVNCFHEIDRLQLIALFSMIVATILVYKLVQRLFSRMVGNALR